MIYRKEKRKKENWESVRYQESAGEAKQKPTVQREEAKRKERKRKIIAHHDARKQHARTQSSSPTARQAARGRDSADYNSRRGKREIEMQ